MAAITLKRLLRRKELSSVVNDIMTALDTPIWIQGLDGTLLMGTPQGKGEQRFAIKLQGNVLGWACSHSPQAAAIADLLTYSLDQEFTKKQLAQETLDKYKELNLIYKLGDRISANLELAGVANLILQEAREIIETTNGSVMLVNDATQSLDVISAFGHESFPKLSLKIGEGIAGHVVTTGKAEIINNVQADQRYVPSAHTLRSLMCVPLKGQEKTLGVINISNHESVQYTAADLKLLGVLASQAAIAIENAILHENKLSEERIKNHLERYLASQVVQAILELEEDINLNPRRRNVAILFSDIRNFTSKCEELAPEQIVNYLNEYFTHMVDVIFKNDGTVNKFVGDMILALFGAPSTLLDSEQRAIQTAINMQRRIAHIPENWIRENFHTGIGITSGQVVVGNIGSPRHMDYTAIGDEVNVAARLQGIATGGQILVSRSVYEASKDLFDFKDFGTVAVKGKKKSVEIFEVVY
ncbi:MAG: GAF domain-containing protein [Leptolyngbya sp. SIOISBB]|nr:GAF domain-containing protein [Leptolyngbya sp. SIOISBB]